MSGLTEKQYVLKKGGLFVGFFGSRVCNELIYLFFNQSVILLRFQFVFFKILNIIENILYSFYNLFQ